MLQQLRDLNPNGEIMKNAKSEGVGTEREQQATNSAELNLAAYLDARPEIGFTKMLLDLALEPQEPFKADARRPFRKSFVIAVVFCSILVGWFVWFNLIR